MSNHVFSYVDVPQGGPEFLLARAGSLGASQVHDAIASTKTGAAASVDKIMTQLIIESITGQPTPPFQSAAMKQGNEREPDARIGYEFTTNSTVKQVGLFRHPRIQRTHASPDGLIVDTKGGLEIKCPLSHTQLELLLTEKIPARYQTQMYWQMACAGLDWVDFCSYDPAFPEEGRFFIKRIERDDAKISALEEKVEAFVQQMLAKEEELRAKLERKAA
jgi:putative phage-type endonuclease